MTYHFVGNILATPIIVVYKISPSANSNRSKSQRTPMMRTIFSIHTALPAGRRRRRWRRIALLAPSTSAAVPRPPTPTAPRRCRRRCADTDRGRPSGRPQQQRQRHTSRGQIAAGRRCRRCRPRQQCGLGGRPARAPRPAAAAPAAPATPFRRRRRRFAVAAGLPRRLRSVRPARGRVPQATSDRGGRRSGAAGGTADGGGAGRRGR